MKKYLDREGNLIESLLANTLINARCELGLSRNALNDEVSFKYNGRDMLRSFTDGILLYNFFRAQALAAKRLGGDAHLLDFGCGWGRFSQIARVDFSPENIISSDISQEALSLAKEQGIPSENLVLLSPGNALPFADATFDVIIANSVFSHLSEQSATFYISELSRTLKRGGVLIFTIRTATWVRWIFKLCKDMEKGKPIPKSAINLIESFKKIMDTFDPTAIKHTFIPLGHNLGADYGEAYFPEEYVYQAWAPSFSNISVGRGEDLGFDQSVVSATK